MVHCLLFSVCPLSILHFLLSIVFSLLSSVHCPLSIVYCESSTVCCRLSSVCLLSIVHRLLSIVYSLLSIVHCLLSIVHWPFSILYRLLSIVCCPLSIVHRLLSVLYCLRAILYCLLSYCPLSTLYCVLSSVQCAVGRAGWHCGGSVRNSGFRFGLQGAVRYGSSAIVSSPWSCAPSPFCWKSSGSNSNLEPPPRFELDDRYVSSQSHKQLDLEWGTNPGTAPRHRAILYAHEYFSRSNMSRPD